jgi:hypothetical protein
VPEPSPTPEPPPAPRATSGASWFERNPRKTLAGLLAGALLLAVAATEAVLERGMAPAAPKRYARLREPPPGLDVLRVANRKEIERTYQTIVDNLEEKPYRFRVDADGFIMPSAVHERPDLKLVFLGGSTTECMFVDEDSRYAHRAGVLLGERFGKKLNSYNGGRSGNNTMHMLTLLLNKVFALQPDVVVFMENANDVNIMLFSGSYWNARAGRTLLVVEDPDSERWRGLLRAAGHALVPALLDRFHRIGVGNENADEFWAQRGKKRVDPNVDARAYEANLITFVETCRARGIVPVLMTQFNRLAERPDDLARRSLEQFERDWHLGYGDYRALLARFNDIVRRVGRERGVQVVDLEARVPKDSRYMYDILHLNTAGSELVAGIVAEELAKNPDIASRLGAGAR